MASGKALALQPLKLVYDNEGRAIALGHRVARLALAHLFGPQLRVGLLGVNRQVLVDAGQVQAGHELASLQPDGHFVDHYSSSKALRTRASMVSMSGRAPPRWRMLAPISNISAVKSGLFSTCSTQSGFTSFAAAYCAISISRGPALSTRSSRVSSSPDGDCFSPVSSR